MSDLEFTKMQALGNDFVVIDSTPATFSLTAQQIQRMGNRRLGIGFDQMLVLESSHEDGVDFIYRIFNADGNEVGQCGNGARALGLFIQKKGLSAKKEWVLKTCETQLVCRVLSDNRVSVRMNPPRFDAAVIPFLPNNPASLDLDFGVVNVGNPHAIIQVDDVNLSTFEEWGKTLGKDSRFPEGVNVSLMKILSPEQIQLRVFERGVGETAACGSAACAAMAYGRQHKGLHQKVLVSQAGGDLEIHWQGADSFMEMIGSADFVFEGRYFLL